MRNDNLNYRTTPRRQAVNSTIVRRSASAGLNLDYRATLRVACRSGRSASSLEYAVRHRSVTRSVTQGIPTLEREER
ncbi:hypothetical protein ALP46_04965 [Pseudomonas amygdali pv. myricae]|nr:hypothetical protein ALP46_04965 [Pseudomonas amygdali pv. myricae]